MLKLLCVWAGETELLFRSYLQGSDIRQLFPRKLTLHIKRERGKKKKKKENEVCVFKTEGPGGGGEENKRAAQKKLKIPARTSLPRKLFLFSNKAMKDEGGQHFPRRERPRERHREVSPAGSLGVDEQICIFPKTRMAGQSRHRCPSQNNPSWGCILQMLPSVCGNNTGPILRASHG